MKMINIDTKDFTIQERTDTRQHNKTTIVRVGARIWRVRVGVKVRVRVRTGLTYFALFG